MRLLKLLLLSLLTVAPWHAQTVDGPLLAKLECPDRVKDVAFSPDGKLLAAGFRWNSQGGVRVWNVADRKVLAILSSNNHGPTSNASPFRRTVSCYRRELERRRACMGHRFVEVAAEHINLPLKCGIKLSAN